MCNNLNKIKQLVANNYTVIQRIQWEMIHYLYKQCPLLNWSPGMMSKSMSVDWSLESCVVWPTDKDESFQRQGNWTSAPITW